MDINALKAKVMEFLKKYRFVILILCIGILLMILPTGKVKEQAPQLSTSQPAIQFDDPTNALTDILSQIKGAGKVRLMLTKGAGERTVYQTNEDRNIGEQNQSVRVETVIVTDKDRAQHGLVQQVLAPEYRGAIVVCQGADDSSVRLAIIEAVADATGLGTDRISVLKMK